MALYAHGDADRDLLPARADTGVLSLSHALHSVAIKWMTLRLFDVLARGRTRGPLAPLPAAVVMPGVEMHAEPGWRSVSSVAFVAELQPGRVTPGLRPRRP